MLLPVRAAICLTLIAATSSTASSIAAGFIENRGQLASDVVCYAPGSPGSVYLTKEALVFDLRSGAHGAAIWIRLRPDAGSNLQLREEVPARLNFFVGGDPAAWRSGVPVFEEAVYQDVRPGIDLSFTLEEGGLAFRMTGAQAPDPDDLFVIDGADRVERTNAGETRFVTQAGSVLLLVSDEDRDAGRLMFDRPAPVDAPPLAGSARVDPSTLVWSTYLGGSGNEMGYGVAVDEAGNPVACGYTPSATFPTTPGAYDVTLGVSDAFVTKLSADTGAMIWGTFLGGAGGEIAYAVALDESGNVVVAGSTGSTDFPTTLGAYDRSHNGSDDLFACTLSSSGTALLWSTFIGGSSSETARSLDQDDDGNLFLAGTTSSTNFPMTAGTYDASSNGSGDAFALKLSSAGSALLWSTYLGGTAYDDAWEIRVDTLGSPTVSGYTASTTFPTTAGAYDQTYNGSDRDIFVTKFAPAGNTLAWSTFLGGSDWDWSYGMDLDSQGNPVLTGGTRSANFPVTSGSYDTTFALYDVFVTKLSSAGDALVWSTFLGGSLSEEGYDIVVGVRDNPIVTGLVASSDFPVTATGFDDSYNGTADAFVALLSPEGEFLCWSTYLGGAGQDRGWSVAEDGLGGAFVCGHTESTAFPTTPGSQDPSHNGGWDAFVCKLNVGDPNSSVSGGEEGRDRALLIWPNPSSGDVSFDLAAARGAPAELLVFDPAGRIVATLRAGSVPAASPRLTWNGSDAFGRRVPAGAYFVRLRAGDEAASGRIVIAR